MLIQENNLEELKAKPTLTILEGPTRLFRLPNGGVLLPEASHKALWELEYFLWLLGERVTTSQAQPTQ